MNMKYQRHEGCSKIQFIFPFYELYLNILKIQRIFLESTSTILFTAIIYFLLYYLRFFYRIFTSKINRS